MAVNKLSRELAEEAIAAVNANPSKLAAARALGLSHGTLDGRLRAALTHYGLSPSPAPEGPRGTVVSEEDRLRDRVRELESLIKTSRADTIDDDYVKRKIIGLADAMQQAGAVPEWVVDVPRGEGLPGVPATLWSDWHWGEVVYPAQINGVNEFNIEVAHRRLRTLVSRTIDLLTHYAPGGRATYPGIVVALGGDMMSGDIHEELSESNELPAMPCLLDLYGGLVSALRAMANTFGRVFVPCVPGNHGRNTKKPRAKGRNHTNFDWLLYQFLAKAFEGDERVQFYIPDGPDAFFAVAGRRYLLTHGDQFRGGDGIIGALGPIIRGNQRKLARNMAIDRAYDTMLLGHWHQYLPLPRVIVNGSLKGYDEYANLNNFGFELPQQALWLTHPEHGITVQMPVILEDPQAAASGESWVSWKDAPPESPRARGRALRAERATAP